MVEAIVFVGAMLCIETDTAVFCQNVTNPVNNKTTFSRTVTDWQKIVPETNYTIEEEVTIEQRNIRPRHKRTFN